jgi:hypothetical protein
MATSSKKAAELLREMLNKNSQDAVTLRWDEFYEVIERERLSDGFMSDLVQKGKDASLHVSFGNATVLVAKDYNFNPLVK